MKVLYSSEEVRDEFVNLLESPQVDDRRIVLVAFVGSQAEAVLPDPFGLEIVCCLKPGATDPLTLDRLQKRGARIFKSPFLHMKVYWSSRMGSVICSANASGNALGGGNQKEAGVSFPPGFVDIDRLWRYAEPQPITDTDLENLIIEEEKIHNPATARASEKRAPSFLEWQSLGWRREWKLGWWLEGNEVGFAQSAKAKAHDTYGARQLHDFLNFGKGQIKSRDWALTFKSDQLTQISWMRVDFVTEIGPKDKAAYDRNYPFQAVQVYKTNKYPTPPFVIDKAFTRAFKLAVKEYGREKIESLTSLKPPKRLLTLIAKMYSGS